MVIEMNMRERIARALAGHFGPRKWEDMPKDRADLKARFRAYDADINEPTQDDCLLAADAVLDALMEPDEGMWDGLARDMMMWLDMAYKTPRALFRHLERIGREIPDWLRNEAEMQSLDHVPSKGTRCVIIYKAMLTAARSGRSGER